MKFLDFLRDFPEFESYDRMFYFDHSVWIRRQNVRWILKNHHKEKPVFLMRHAAIGRTVRQEVEAAQAQSRYAEAMPATIEWINELRQQGHDPDTIPVEATTIIFRSIAGRARRKIGRLLRRSP